MSLEPLGMFTLQEEVSSLTKEVIVQFTPMLADTRRPNPDWNGNMPLSPLESVPVLSVVGDTSTMVCKNRNHCVCF